MVYHGGAQKVKGRAREDILILLKCSNIWRTRELLSQADLALGYMIDRNLRFLLFSHTEYVLKIGGRSGDHDSAQIEMKKDLG